MKKLIVVCCIAVLSTIASAQSQEAQQLLLNWEKLTQFKKILQNMKQGYQVLHKGYTTIKDLSQGNFSLHKTFLDALFEVSPAVRKYKRIADIVNYQFRMVKEYKAAFNQFKASDQFTSTELEYISKVYANLFKQGLRSLDELSMVITSGRLRMSDDERLEAIDGIYDRIEDQYSFLQQFNNQTAVLVVQREKEQGEIKKMRSVHGLK